MVSEEQAAKTTRTALATIDAEVRAERDRFMGFLLGDDASTIGANVMHAGEGTAK